MSAKNIDTGRNGEQMAVDHLLAMGYQIIARNYRIGHLEIDIIARREQTIHIVEVKTRRESCIEQFSPQNAFNRAKLERIVRAAEQYIAQQTITDCDYTIDLIAVFVLSERENRLTHYENVQWLF